MFLNSNTYYAGYGPNSAHLTDFKTASYDTGVSEETNNFSVLHQFVLFFQTIKSKLHFRFKKKSKCIRNLNFRLKVTRKRFKKYKPVRTKFTYNKFAIIHKPLVKNYNKFKHKIRKMDIRRPFKIILRSRRLLRVL